MMYNNTQNMYYGSYPNVYQISNPNEDDMGYPQKSGGIVKKVLPQAAQPGSMTQVSMATYLSVTPRSSFPTPVRPIEHQQQTVRQHDNQYVEQEYQQHMDQMRYQPHNPAPQQLIGGMHHSEYFQAAPQHQHHDYMSQMHLRSQEQLYQPQEQHQYDHGHHGQQQQHEQHDEQQNVEESVSSHFDTDEPIEAGSFGRRMARKSRSEHDQHEYQSSRGSTGTRDSPDMGMGPGLQRRFPPRKMAPGDDEFFGSLPFKRPGLSWDTMTDEEREEAQRLKRKEEAFKTALCDAFKRTGTCSYGESCRFAHGEHQLRLPAQPRGKAHPKYKTQLCDKFSSQGICPYGQRCQFIHKLKKGLPLIKYEHLLATGEISPAKESETKLVDHERSPGRSYNPTPATGPTAGTATGWQTLRLDVPPPIVMKRGYKDRTPSSNKVDLQQRQTRKPFYSTENLFHAGGDELSNQFQDLRMYASTDSIKDAVERKTLERNEQRRRFEQEILSLPPQERSGSLQTLSEFRATVNSTPKDVIRGSRRSLIPPEQLSMVVEEPDKENMDGSVVHGSRVEMQRVVEKERRQSTGNWQEVLFGKKLPPIDEVGHEMEGGHQQGDEQQVDPELLVQSCDEELLAGGLYNHRYQFDPNELRQKWNLNN